MTAIAIDSLSVSYGKKSILSGVSISVDEGRWTGIIGPNGSGKSTLLRAVVGSLDYDGTIRVLDQDVAEGDLRALGATVRAS